MPLEPKSDAAAAFRLASRWRIEGTCGEVADILDDPLDFVRWWPSVYRSATEVAPAGPGGVGRRVAFLTQGWLPYSLSWDATVVERHYPHHATIAAQGDLEGIGIWTLTQDGAWVNVTFDWQVELRKPGLRVLRPWLWRAFEGNHRWAMRQGEMSLALEVARRRATQDAARSSVPPPPGPVTYAAAGMVCGAAVVAGTLIYLMTKASGARRRRRRARAIAQSDS